MPATASTTSASAKEPAEIRQLRLQVHQYCRSDCGGYARPEETAAGNCEATRGEVALSPTVEEEYKRLTRDYENAQKNYQDLLAKKSTADLTVKMNNQSAGRANVCR